MVYLCHALLQLLLYVLQSLERGLCLGLLGLANGLRVLLNLVVEDLKNAMGI